MPFYLTALLEISVPHCSTWEPNTYRLFGFENQVENECSEKAKNE
jgi:hypothetical protein